MIRSSKPLPKDVNQFAAELVRRSTEELEAPATEMPSPAAMTAYFTALGRAGGLKGGRRRAEILSPRKRKQIARKAAETRWKKKRLAAKRTAFI